MRRSKPAKGRRAARSGPTKAKLDKLCREVVLARDGWRCRKCGAAGEALQWAHIHSRRFLSTRWELSNSVALCARCHWAGHDHPVFFAEWVATILSPAELAHLRDKLKKAERPDPEAQALFLQQELERLTAS